MLAFSVLLSGVLMPSFLSIILYEHNILVDTLSSRILSLFAYASFFSYALIAARLLLLRPTSAWVVTVCIGASSVIQIFSAHVWILPIGLLSFVYSVACMIEENRKLDGLP
jgi:hypothetical protein